MTLGESMGSWVRRRWGRFAWWWGRHWDAVLDVGGLAVIPTGIWILAGVGWALIAAGPVIVVASWHLKHRKS